ncbi:toxin-antitoxin system, toxin component (plasmid) [Streptomyces sp. BI20]|uniref:toxin-antitoxin system, toxin component n=1 Tax=Streptomyces sp. BI20 TaxID=3403460 RepID=UPI003C749446
MSQDRRIARLCREVVRQLPSPPPSDPRELMHAVCAHFARWRGEVVRLMFRPFPPNTVSGVWIRIAPAEGVENLICVEENTSPEHQLVILGHEIWHMVAEDETGRCSGRHPARAARAVDRDLGPGLDPDLVATIDLIAAAAAARTDIGADDEEAWAERCGLVLATALRRRLAEHAPDADGVAGRIRTSLGG